MTQMRTVLVRLLRRFLTRWREMAHAFATLWNRPPRSLRRWALRQRARYQHPRWAARWGLAAGIHAVALAKQARGLALFPISVLALAGILYLPLGSYSLPALSQPGATQHFLELIWPVDAAASTIGVAVVVFAFQTVQGSRFASVLSLRDYASQWPLVVSVAIGLGSLFITAVMLLFHTGSGGLDGWAGSYAASLGAISLLTLPAVLLTAILQLDDAALHRRRLRQLRAQIEADAADRSVALIAARGLREFCRGTPVRYSIYRLGEGGGISLLADRGGEVTDVKLRRVISIGNALKARAIGEVDLSVIMSIGDAVSKGTPWLELPTTATERDIGRLRHAIRIAPQRPIDRLNDTVRSLSDEAMELIRDGRLRWYQDAAAAYTQLFTTTIAVWNMEPPIKSDNSREPSYRPRFARVPGYSDEADRLTETVRHNATGRALLDLANQVRAAADRTDPEIWSAVMRLPISLVWACRRKGAVYMVDRLLALIVSAYETFKRLDGERAKTVAEAAQAAVLSINESAMTSVMEGSIADVEDDEAMALTTVYAAEDLLKIIAQSDDLEGFDRVNESLTRALESGNASMSKERAVCRKRLTAQLQATRFALSVMFVNTALKNPLSRERADVIRRLGHSLGVFDDIAVEADAALNLDRKRYSLWRRWNWEPTLGTDRDTAILGAFVVLGTIALISDGTAPSHQKWFLSRRDQIEYAAASIEQAQMWTGLGLTGAQDLLVQRLAKLAN